MLTYVFVKIWKFQRNIFEKDAISLINVKTSGTAATNTRTSALNVYSKLC